MKIRSKVTEADRQEVIDACRRSTEEELIQFLKEVEQVERECRSSVGLSEEDVVPFFVNPFTELFVREITHELDLREHSFVDQGSTDSLLLEN